jgi:deferrochelatase/peroxidase EfeB
VPTPPIGRRQFVVSAGGALFCTLAGHRLTADSKIDLDQGLMFVAFNQDPTRQFVTIQNRLSTEPMVDYITPVGGGYFFAPPGARGEADWVGSGLAD